jgi:hypothetical protein
VSQTVQFPHRPYDQVKLLIDRCSDSSLVSDYASLDVSLVEILHTNVGRLFRRNTATTGPLWTCPDNGEDMWQVLTSAPDMTEEPDIRLSFFAEGLDRFLSRNKGAVLDVYTGVVGVKPSPYPPSKLDSDAGLSRDIACARIPMSFILAPDSEGEDDQETTGSSATQGNEQAAQGKSESDRPQSDALKTPRKSKGKRAPRQGVKPKGNNNDDSAASPAPTKRKTRGDTGTQEKPPKKSKGRKRRKV